MIADSIQFDLRINQRSSAKICGKILGLCRRFAAHASGAVLGNNDLAFGRGAALKSEAMRRRSRCGSVRGCPVLNLHFAPGLAPQIGQWMACICLRVRFLVFMTVDYPAIPTLRNVHFCTWLGIFLGGGDSAAMIVWGAAPVSNPRLSARSAVGFSDLRHQRKSVAKLRTCITSHRPTHGTFPESALDVRLNWMVERSLLCLRRRCAFWCRDPGSWRRTRF
jgi:hypothetical protein